MIVDVVELVFSIENNEHEASMEAKNMSYVARRAGKKLFGAIVLSSQ